MSKTSKVGIIGAGNVGADVANALVLLGRCVRVVLFDRTLSKAGGGASPAPLYTALTE
ncbi:hypothetical protein [Nostoc sp.]|uniref:hypothetical protein n=1 Tax=Nostoc sp. TaxID=1180 RepID=UPI002FF5CCE9